MEAIELKACVRKETGKGPARRFRKKGLTPAVFYGRGEEAIPLSVNVTDLTKIIKTRKENIFIKLLKDYFTCLFQFCRNFRGNKFARFYHRFFR